MNQGAKTLTFVVVAAVVGCLAWATYPRPNYSARAEIGQALFPKLADVDPNTVKDLEIVTFDEEQAAFDPFQVKQVDGRWVLPSHQNYPADAKQHMVDAAKALVGLNIENIVSDKPAEHGEYGVIDPDPNAIKPGVKGVGKRITAKGDKDQIIAQFIVGNSPKDKTDYRYVREVGNNKVYLVKLNPESWSSKFADWIEKDLLKIDSFNIKELTLRDYNVERGVTPDGDVGIGKSERMEAVLDYDDAKSTWSVAKLVQFNEKGEPVLDKVRENEELNSQRLNDLKTALNDLKIVDVERKPAGLESTLEEFLKKTGRSGVGSLAKHGFIPFQNPRDGRVDILSNDGEVICGMKDGVEYVLRFGEIAGASDEGGQDNAETKPDDKKEKSSVNRYIFVMARVNEDLIKPMLEPLPTEEPPEKKPTDPPADKKPDVPQNKGAVGEKGAGDADKKDPAAGAADDPTKVNDKKPDDKSDDPAAKKDDPEAAKKRIEADNQRKLDEYQTKLKQAQDKVKNLNKRFGEWYYVIADSEYKKVHLSRADLVRKKEVPKGQGSGADDFNELEKGIEKKPATPPDLGIPDFGRPDPSRP